MPILVTCTCGKSLRAPDAFAGRRVKCPSCGTQVLLPGTAPARTAADGRPAAAPTPPPGSPAAVVRFSCECGKEMQAKAEYGGRLARCPACGENVLIPEGANGAPRSRARAGNGSPDARAFAAKPAPSPKRAAPPPAEEEEVAELEEVEEVDEAEEERPRKRRAADANGYHKGEDERPRRRSGRNLNVKKGGNRALLWVNLVVIFILLLGGGGAAWWWMRKSPSATDDLVFVPGNVQGFLSVRPADMAGTALGKKIIAQLPPAARAQFNALQPADIERISVVFFNMQAENPEEGLWVVVLAKKPLDKDQILKQSGDTYKEKTDKEGKSYYVPTQENNPHAWFAGDRVLVLGKGPALERARQLPATRTPGPLDAVLGDVQASRHFVAAFVPPAPPPQQAGMPEPPIMKALRDTKLITLSADVSDGASGRVSLEFASDDKAKAAKAAVDQALEQMKAMMAMFGGAVPGPGGADPAAKLKDTLKSLKVEQNGPAISMKISLDGDTVSTLVSQAAMAGPLGGPLGGPPNPAARPVPGAQGAAKPAVPPPGKKSVRPGRPAAPGGKS